MSMLEKTIQSQILNRLKNSGWFAFKTIISNKAGMPDIYCVRQGRHVWIEVKQANGRTSPIQDHIHNELKQQGAEVYIIKSLEELDNVLNDDKFRGVSFDTKETKHKKDDE